MPEMIPVWAREYVAVYVEDHGHICSTTRPKNRRRPVRVYAVNVNDIGVLIIEELLHIHIRASIIDSFDRDTDLPEHTAL